MNNTTTPDTETFSPGKEYQTNCKDQEQLHKLVINPDLKSLIPPLSGEERAGLEANLIANGCEDAIKVFNGMVIDGFNRYELCHKHGIPFDVQEVEIEIEGDSLDPVRKWMIERQIGKRNLTPAQRIELADKLIGESVRAEAKERKKRKPNSLGAQMPQQKTREVIAETAGVSPRQVSKLQKIKKEAPPEVVDQVMNGEVSIGKAHDNLKSNQHTLKTKESKTFPENSPISDMLDFVKASTGATKTVSPSIKITIETSRSTGIDIEPVLEKLGLLDSISDVVKFLDYRRDELKKQIKSIGALSRLLKPFERKPSELSNAIKESMQQSWTGLFQKAQSSRKKVDRTYRPNPKLKSGKW